MRKPSYSALWLHHIARCAGTQVCVSRKGGTGGGAWGHPQGAVQMVPARFGCKRPWLALGESILALAA